MRKYFHEHNNELKAKRNKEYHDKFRKELVNQQKDRKRNAVYASGIGCETTENINRCAKKMYEYSGERKHKYAQIVCVLWKGSEDRDSGDTSGVNESSTKCYH